MRLIELKNEDMHDNDDDSCVGKYKGHIGTTLPPHQGQPRPRLHHLHVQQQPAVGREDTRGGAGTGGNHQEGAPAQVVLVDVQAASAVPTRVPEVSIAKLHQVIRALG